MIQRVQSLYILTATVLMALVSHLPLMEFMSEGSDYLFFATGFMQEETIVLATTPLLILLLTSTAFNAVAFFSFKKRLLQIRLLVFSIVLQLGSYGLGAYYIIRVKDTVIGPFSPSIPMTFPIISAILSFLAIRAIGKDEALVRSLDRIR